MSGSLVNIINIYSLNHDILEHIVSFLDSPDALALCETSRWVHSVANEHALSCVVVKSHRMIPRMSAYFLDDPCRLYLLRELDVICDFEEALPEPAWDAWKEGVVRPGYVVRDYKSVQPLADLLEQARNLRIVKLNLAEKLFREEPRLGDAMTTLPRLEELELTCVGSRCVKLVRGLQKTPRRLLLMDILNTADFRSVLEALAAHQDVEELTLVYVMPHYIAMSAMNSPRWPSVKKVTTHGIPIPLLEHAFPRAERLHAF